MVARREAAAQPRPLFTFVCASWAFAGAQLCTPTRLTANGRPDTGGYVYMSWAVWTCSWTVEALQ